MKTASISANQTVQYQKTNKGKKFGAAAGLAAGAAVNIQNAKPLLGYINRNLGKIQAKYPNIKGDYTDVFKAYLTSSKDKNPWISIIKSFLPQEGKKGIVIAKSNSAIAKKAAIMGGIVATGVLVGTTIGAVADKIKNNKLKKQAELKQILTNTLAEKIKNASSISLDEFQKL